MNILYKSDCFVLVFPNYIPKQEEVAIINESIPGHVQIFIIDKCVACLLQYSKVTVKLSSPLTVLLLPRAFVFGNMYLHNIILLFFLFIIFYDNTITPNAEDASTCPQK